ncbi:tRNA-specific adenosine deaminase subunit tad2 [Diplonema papillatum]|nr:tRNA-specific adenosine deaminase subunit tad2 [Diplonema papillatum]
MTGDELEATYNAKFMEQAFGEAEEAQGADEVPIGCVFVKGGEVVARGRNRTNETCNGCAHAEIVAAWELRRQRPADASLLLRGSELYVTVEPCVMCCSALLLLEVSHVFYGCNNERFGGCSGVLDIHAVNPFRPLPCFGGKMKTRAVALLQAFYESENVNCPEGKRRKKDKPA